MSQYGRRFRLFGHKTPISVTSGAASTYLLDLYPNAKIATSVRLLSSTYSGALVELQRDSDNAVKSFYPDSNDVISMDSEDGSGTSLTTWIGANTASVRTWFDQSGNSNDMVQNTVSAQPILVAAGVLNTRYGIAAVKGVAAGYLRAGTTLAQPFTVFGGMGGQAINDGTWLNDAALTTNRLYVETGSGSYNLKMNSGSNLVDTDNVSLEGMNTCYCLFNGASSEIAIDGQAVQVGNTNVNDWTTNITMFGRGSVNSLLGYIQETVIYESDESANYVAIEANMNTYFKYHWDGSVTSLLDDYSGAEAGYSVRALNSAYTDYGLRVRRSSDSAELDIRLNYDGSLDTISLEEFSLGTDDVFVTDWYDQSGNSRTLPQLTATRQAMIVDAGSVLLKNGKTNTDFTRSTDGYSSYGLSWALNQPYSSFGVVTKTQTVGNPSSLVMAQNGSNNNRIFATNTSDNFYSTFGTTLASSIGFTLGEQSLLYSTANGASSEVSLNGTLTTGNAGTNNFSRLTIGTYSGSSQGWDGQFQEYVLFGADKTATAGDIKENIAAYYGGVLDSYPMEYAYSAMRLSIYSTDVIRVRRSSDNAESDFTPEEITDGTLTTWTGANDGLVVTWYNQGSAASADPTQATAAYQARIVTAGVLETDLNGDPSADFKHDGVNMGYYQVTNAAIFNQPFTAFMSGEADVVGGYIYKVGGGSGNILLGFANSTTARMNLSGTDDETISLSTGTQFKMYGLGNGASSEVGIDGATVAMPTVGTGASAHVVIGARSGTQTGFDGHITTILFTEGDESANRTEIEEYL